MDNTEIDLTDSTALPPSERLSTGIRGADDILQGGLISGRSTLIRGPPGSGKTLFGLHYLSAGADDGDTLLFINFDEPLDYIRRGAIDFELNLDTVHYVDLSSSEDEFGEEERYGLFSPADVEGAPLREELGTIIDEIDPDRVFIDAVSQFREISSNSYHFRKQMRALLRLLEQQGATAVFTAPVFDASVDEDLQFTADTVIHLDYPEELDRRSIRVVKFRESDFQSGWHSLRIDDQGVTVTPKLVPDSTAIEFSDESVSSGVPELDDLLYGGLERGTVTMFSGPTGVGKTTTALQFISERATEGERSVLYSFEENLSTLIHRGEALGIPVREMLEDETLHIEHIHPRELTVDEFANRVQQEVETRDTQFVAIDGVNGYRNALTGAGDSTIEELTSLNTYLRTQGVTTVLTNEIHQITGAFNATEAGLSYLTDNLIFFRHVEYQGELRKVVGVLKKRTSDYEHQLRELEITEDGIKVGDPLTHLRGILTGTPEWTAQENTDV